MSKSNMSVIQDTVNLYKKNIEIKLLNQLNKGYEKLRIELFNNNPICNEIANSLKLQVIEELKLCCNYQQYGLKELKNISINNLNDLRKLAKDLKSLIIETTYVNKDGVLSYIFINVFDFIEVTMIQNEPVIELKFSNEMIITL